MFIKRLPFFKKRIRANILYKFYERIIMSAALIFSSDLALMLIPIPAS
jgi:hypothetical protein